MLLDVRKQLTFYGAYHSNPTNVLIHITCVPIILWTYMVMLQLLPPVSWIPTMNFKLNDYMEFEFRSATFIWIFYICYYTLMEPIAGLLYAPQFIVSLLTAISVAHRPGSLHWVIPIHVGAWIAQFIGHGVAEKRSPALLDNIVGALVLAPFFVHLECLFRLGYRPEFQKVLKSDIGVEIAKIRKAEGDQKRSKEKKAQ